MEEAPQTRLARLLADDVSAREGVTTQQQLLLPCFEAHWIGAMRANEYDCAVEAPAAELYLVCDPSAGRNRDLCAVVSLVWSGNRMLVLSADVRSYTQDRHTSLNDLLRYQLDTCRRQHSFVSDARVTILVDADLPGIVREMQRTWDTRATVTAFDAQNTPGHRRAEALHTLRVYARDGALVLARDFAGHFTNERETLLTQATRAVYIQDKHSLFCPLGQSIELIRLLQLALCVRNLGG